MREIRYLISDASKKVEAEAHVLRYWEDELGLDIPRNELGHRYYREEDVELLMSIKRLKEKGFQLKAIRMLLPDVKQIARLENDRLIDLRDKLDELLGIGRDSEEQIEAVYKEIEEDYEMQEPAKDNNLKGYRRGTEEIKDADLSKKMNRNEVKTEDSFQPAGLTIDESIKDAADSTYSTNLQDKRDTSRESSKVIDMTSVISIDHSEIINKGEEDGRWESKMIEFRAIMNSIMSEAVKKNNGTLVRELNNAVSESVRKEVDYLLHLKEEREEERFKKLDRTIREFQMSRQQTAAAVEVDKKKKKSKFFKKNKVRI